MSASVKEDFLHLSWCKDDSDDLELTVGHASILINEIRIRGASNSETPYRILGKGGASLMLTQKQLLKFLAEYLRYVLFDPIEYTQEDTSHSFSFIKKDKQCLKKTLKL